jgi:mRNA-degrading endonuclease YafQ of YafQ-DinJ toxin-antitoxin module
MKLALAARFQSDVRALSAEERRAVFEVILAVPRAMGQPHFHAGLGMRKLHASGIWEARVGLKIRVVFTMAGDTVTFVRAGTHEAIRQYLRNL